MVLLGDGGIPFDSAQGCADQDDLYCLHFGICKGKYRCLEIYIDIDKLFINITVILMAVITEAGLHS